MTKNYLIVNTNKKGDNPYEEVSPLPFFVCYYSKNGYPQFSTIKLYY